jgi:aminopeptidase N
MRAAMAGLAAWLLLGIACPSSAAPRETLPDNALPESYRIEITPDVAAMRFQGVATLRFRMLERAASVTVNGIDLIVDSAVLDGAVTARVAVDSTRERIRFAFPRPLGIGAHQLRVAYRGRIAQSALGVFVSDYATAEGRRQALTTQFEPGDARRLAPMWDEPARKAVFELAITAPASQPVVSNMPVASTEPKNGLVTTRFQPSPRMSSYLLHFSIGDFERITRSGEGSAAATTIGIVSRRGTAAQGQFALDSAATLLDYYNDYFGIPYPLPKLDLIAVAGSSSVAAMENWGAILFFDQFLLLDPAVASERNRQIVYIDVAHEISHQWFGNLVTMSWWDDLWLNEGFASWMERKAAARFHPQWNPWLSDGGRERVLALDANAASHPVVREIRNSTEANSGFDAISYDKGAEVIRMLEAYMGEEAFRAGVRDYMRRHAYGNTRSADLWESLSSASDVPVAQIAHDFTEQTGVPLIRVLGSRCDEARHLTRITLTQQRFGVDAASLQPQRWHVPVVVRNLEGAAAQQVVTGAKPVTLDLAGCAPFQINAGQNGYYRVAYDPQSWQSIAAALPRLAAIDQQGLMSDSLSLGLAGLGPIDEFAELSLALPADADPLVQRALSAALMQLDTLYQGLPGQPRFRRFAIGRLGPLLERITWNRQAGESDNTALLRSDLIGALAHLGDTDTLAEARRRFEASLTDEGSLPADIYNAVLGATGAGADARIQDLLRAQARVAASSTRQELFLEAAASATDPALADRALNESLAADTPLQLAPDLLYVISGRHPDRTWRFVVAHYAALRERLDPLGQLEFAARIAGFRNDAGAGADLSAFARGHLPSEATSNVARAQAALKYRQRVRRERLRALDRWLAR